MVNRDVNGVTVLALDGRIVFGEETNALRETLKDLLAEGKKKLVLNMDHVPYLDSSGIGTLIGGYSSAKSQGGSLCLCCVGPRCTEVLGLLPGVIGIFDTEANAVRSLSR
jgi:anti-anti-sigma factor